MSASIRPTRCPSCASAAARFADTVDFPTPPLPLEIARTLPSDGISSGVGGAGGAAAGRPDGRAAGCAPPAPSAESTTFIFTPVTPGTPSTAFRAWRASDPGSSRVSTKVNVTAPAESTVTSFTIPAATRSRPWRGFVIPPSARSTSVLIVNSLTRARHWQGTRARHAAPSPPPPPWCPAMMHPRRDDGRRHRTDWRAPRRPPRPSSERRL